MPWYWSDDIAQVLQTTHSVGDEVVVAVGSTIVAIRREEPSIEAAVAGMLDDDEIPLAA